MTGKVKHIARMSGCTYSDLKFDYDAMSNRVAKYLYNSSGVLQKATYYVHDAQGNEMATYDYVVNSGGSTITYTLKEQPIYGSSRLGMDINQAEMLQISPFVRAAGTLGNRQYELTNHLGNVLSVITDRKVTKLDIHNLFFHHYEPVIVSATDYYPFGMIMPGRSYRAYSSYRFGYQGSIKDDEIQGVGNSYSTIFRELDPRLGIWWGGDPETRASESPFVSMGDNPIKNNDVRGNSVDGGEDPKPKPAITSINISKIPKSSTVKHTTYGANTNISWLYQKETDADGKPTLKGLGGLATTQEVDITAKRTTPVSPSTPLDRAMAQVITAYQSPDFFSTNPLEPFKMPSLMPDAYGITLQGTFIPVMGATGSISAGVVDQHFGVWVGIGPGVGADIGGSLTGFAAYHVGNGRGFASYMGASHNVSVGIGPLAFGGSTDISTTKNGQFTYGQNWDSYSLGMGFRAPFILTGSTQVTTSVPLFISH